MTRFSETLASKSSSKSHEILLQSNKSWLTVRLTLIFDKQPHLFI